MLRRLKLELKRQEAQQQADAANGLAAAPKEAPAHPMGASNNLAEHKQQVAMGAKTRRSRRSSKPAMEKRRRARINECLDTLKSYVLYDRSTLARLGIDASQSENQDEETIARRILKSSGLIHRHKGRKNPNKLEKADILELTVDYVRQLHEQRNELLVGSSSLTRQQQQQQPRNQLQLQQQQPQPQPQSPTTTSGLATATSAPQLATGSCALDASKPLLLQLPDAANNRLDTAHLPSPPPSSASNSPQPLLSISSNIVPVAHASMSPAAVAALDAANSILDLSASRAPQVR